MAEYPKTAEEYAKQLNAEDPPEGWEGGGGFTLVTDPEHWAQYDVHTGEDLARYLAIEAHWDAYKDAYGIRPRGVNYDDMTIEEIEADIEELYRDAQYRDEYEREMMDYYPPQSEEHPDPLRKMEPDPYDDEETMALDTEEDWQHTPKMTGMGRAAGAPRRVREEGVVTLGRAELRELISEALHNR